MSSSLIPVGLDISSLYSRVAIDGRQGVVSNTQGERFTLSLVGKEESGDYVFGDAGQRLAGHSSLKDAEEEAAQAYLRYLVQLAADNAAVSVDQLRLVMTVPAGDINWWDRVNQACKSLIPDKKKRKEGCVVGVMTKAAATCVAQEALEGRILVVDMDGDTSLLLTVLSVDAGVYTEVSATTVDNVSGPALLQILATHVATHFERQNRLQKGEVWESKKAKNKLLKEAQRVLLSNGNTMKFMIDGLYDGMDCNVNVSKPRWELMTSALLAQVETALQVIEDVDSVLLSGAWATSVLKHSVQKVFEDKLKATTVVTPEEAVVLGCAKQAGWILAKPGMSITTTTSEVTVSPVSIGIDDVILIPQGTPLPAKSNHTLAAASKLYQLAPQKVELADLNVEEETILTVELSLEGQLSIGFPGQPVMVI